MKIAILGGTGQLGRRLAEAWDKGGHEVVLGSRNPKETSRKVSEWSRPCTVTSHVEAVENSRVIVLSVPAAATRALVEMIGPYLESEAVVLSVIVPLESGAPTRFVPPEEGSIAEHVAAHLPEGVAVAAGFHTVSAAKEGNEGDVLFCGQTKEARALVAELAEYLGMRPVDCGPLRMAETLERLTPLLIGINQRYRIHGAGVHVTGLH